jgi:hypothetical protein
MRLLYVKILTILSFLSGLGLFFAAWHVGNLPLLDFPALSVKSPAPQKSSVPANEAIVGPEPLVIAFERPLFRPDRKPFDPRKDVVIAEPLPLPPPPEPEIAALPVEVVPAAVAVFPQLTLRGIHMTGQIDKALLETPETPLGSWMTVGTIVLNWRLKTITSDSVTFSLGDQTQILKLYVDNPTNSIGNPQQQQ